MKSIINKLFPVLLLIVAFGLPSCTEDENQWIYNGNALASFPNETTAAFLIQDVANPTFGVEIALNTVSGSARTVNVYVDEANSTAVENTHFTMSHSVTIAANEVIGTLNVEGIYANLPNQPLTLVIKIDSTIAADYDNSYVLSLNKFVPFDIANFVGDFECTEYSYFGTFTYDVTLFQETGENAVWVTPVGAGMEAGYGLPLGGLNDFKVTFNVSDPLSYSTTLEEQQAFLNGDTPWFYSAATGTLNTLTNSFTLGRVDIYDDGGLWDIISGFEYTAKTSK